MNEDDSLDMRDGYVRRIRMNDKSIVLCLVSKVDRKPEDKSDTYSAVVLFRQRLKWIFGTGTTQRDAVESLIEFYDRYAKSCFA